MSLQIKIGFLRIITVILNRSASFQPSSVGPVQNTNVKVRTVINLSNFLHCAKGPEMLEQSSQRVILLLTRAVLREDGPIKQLRKVVLKSLIASQNELKLQTA